MNIEDITEDFHFPKKKETIIKTDKGSRKTGHGWAMELRRHKAMEEQQNQISPLNARLIISTAEFFELIGELDRVPPQLKSKANEIILDLERYKTDEERQGQWSPVNNSLIMRIIEWIHTS